MQAFGAKHSGEVGFQSKFVRSGSLALSLTNSSENFENLGFRFDLRTLLCYLNPAQGKSVG